jgi:hypothetical protein
MRRSIRLWALVLAALGFGALAGRAPASGLEVGSGSRLWLEGKSTMHDYESTASKLDATLRQDESRWPAEARGVEAIEGFVRAHGVTSIEVVVPVTGLHSKKAGLDKNMYKALAAAKHPEIRFRMSEYDVADGVAEAMTLGAKGLLEVAGVERPIELTVKAIREGDRLRLRGSTPLLMSSFGIKPPTMMMGTLKVADRVVVSFDLVLEARSDAPPRPE